MAVCDMGPSFSFQVYNMNRQDYLSVSSLWSQFAQIKALKVPVLKSWILFTQGLEYYSCLPQTVILVINVLVCGCRISGDIIHLEAIVSVHSTIRQLLILRKILLEATTEDQLYAKTLKDDG